MPIYRKFNYVVREEYFRRGFRYDPPHVSGLKIMATLTIATELLQFTFAMQWLRTSIPKSSAFIQLLLDAPERSYNVSGKNSKRFLHLIAFQHIGWCQTEIAAFENCQLVLSNCIRLVQHNHIKRLCFYVDASDT